MIKDKITPELKKAFSESIKKTEDSGNEHGFFMCINKDGKLSPSQIKCEGNTCEINVRLSSEFCPGKNQGFFHVHPRKLQYEKQIGRKLTEEDLKNITVTDEKGKITSIHTPSHADVLTIFLNKCNRLTEGTICTAGDLEPDKIECWTPKKGAVNLVTCHYANRENLSIKEKGIEPKMWIKHLFSKEVIDLKKDP